MIRVFKLMGADWMRAPIAGTCAGVCIVYAALSAYSGNIDRAILLAILCLVVLNGRDAK